MSIHEVSAEQLAEFFHHLSPGTWPRLGCTAQSKPESWDEISQPEKNRMVAAARLAILEVASTASKRKKRDAISRSQALPSGAASPAELKGQK